MSFKALGFPEDIHNFNESMPVQDCEALNRLFYFSSFASSCGMRKAV